MTTSEASQKHGISFLVFLLLSLGLHLSSRANRSDVLNFTLKRAVYCTTCLIRITSTAGVHVVRFSFHDIPLHWHPNELSKQKHWRVWISVYDKRFFVTEFTTIVGRSSNQLLFLNVWKTCNADSGAWNMQFVWHGQGDQNCLFCSVDCHQKFSILQGQGFFLRERCVEKLEKDWKPLQPKVVSETNYIALATSNNESAIWTQIFQSSANKGFE